MTTQTEASLKSKPLEQFDLNPLTSTGDQHETSPYNILTLSSKQVMRKFKLIR